MANVRIDIRYVGKDRVQESIENVLNAIQPPSLTESVGKGADEFVKAVQDAAPVKSGALRSSIDKVAVDDNKFQIGPRGVVYAAMQNYGGDVHSNRPGGYMGPIPGDGPQYIKDARIPATDYMNKGFATGMVPAAEAVKTSITEHIESS